MARLAIPAIRAAIQTRLGAELAPDRIVVRAALQSDVEQDLDGREEGETLSEAAWPYVTVGVEAGEIESGLRGSTDRGSVLVTVLVWGRRGVAGEMASQVDLGERIAGQLDAWAHSETGLRWTCARLHEAEEYTPRGAGPGLDGIGAVWEIAVTYCG